MTANSSKPKVAFQGTKDAYSDVAASELFTSSKAFKTGSLETIGYDTLIEVCDAVKKGDVTYGLIPLENSSTGTFLSSYELLNDYGLFIVGEYCAKETHCLVALPGVKLEDISEIKSHPFAIEQCSKYLAGLNKKVTISQALDTAGSAELIRSKELKNTAAIAGYAAAKLHYLNILVEGIEDYKPSITRYVLVSSNKFVPERHLEPKTSVSLMVKNTTGAFYKALACFALRDINITKVETRPSTRSITLTNPWEYVLYIDIDGGMNDPKVAAALSNLEEFALQIRVLGSYPRHQPLRDVPLTPYGISM